MQWLIDIVLESMVGMIVAWYGTFADIPDGWQACDGSNGTPDLRRKFIWGAGLGNPLFGTGGTETHTHPGESAHHHDIDSGKNIAAGTGFRNRTDSAQSVGNTGSSGTVPPYMVLWFIMKMPAS